MTRCEYQNMTATQLFRGLLQGNINNAPHCDPPLLQTTEISSPSVEGDLKVVIGDLKTFGGGCQISSFMNSSSKKSGKKCTCLVKPYARNRVPIIWVVGGPGSGKGTQCQLIIKKYGFIHLSTGDMFRAEVRSGTERGWFLKQIMDRGELVSTHLTLTILKDHVRRALMAENCRGILIDGFPRELEQGILFEKTVAVADCIMFFDASDLTLLARLTQRGETGLRSDDNEESIKFRIQIFHATNSKIIDHYVHKTKRINAEFDVKRVWAQVDRFLGQLVKLF